MRSRTFLAWVFTLSLLLILTSPFAARTWYIKADGSGDGPTIQSGVDSSAVGDTILVANGTHSGCGLIGAFEVNCGTVPAGRYTIGSLKALFQNLRNDSASVNLNQIKKE